MIIDAVAVYWVFFALASVGFLSGQVDCVPAARVVVINLAMA